MVDPELMQSRMPVEYDDPYAEGPTYFSDCQQACGQSDQQCPYGDLETARLSDLLNKSNDQENCIERPLSDPDTSNCVGDVATKTSPKNLYENSLNPPEKSEEEEEDEADSYTDLQEELCELNEKIEGRLKDSTCQPAASHPVVALPQDDLPEIDAGIYDSPWDLNAAQKGFEERLRVGSKFESPSELLDGREDFQTCSSVQSFSKCPKSLDRQMKENVAIDTPSMRNSKTKEYTVEKTTDKKIIDPAPAPFAVGVPTFDSRPLEDYDNPWDQKRSIIDEISSKFESSSELLDGREDFRTCSSVQSFSKCPKSLDRQMKENVAIDTPSMRNIKTKEYTVEKTTDKKMIDPAPAPFAVGVPTFDSRPLEDYDNPWDQKRSIIDEITPEIHPFKVILSGTVMSTSQMEERTFRQSPSRISTLAERIDSKLPLEQQWWYHGSITRVEAENRLQPEREGSYLIRNSESNRLDYSLSVKSTHGCMHMKIVTNTEGRFILGQFSQPFVSISQMLHHYTIHKLPIKGAEHMSLTVPVRR